MSLFTNQFEELCPYFMSIGMSYDEYWNGDPYLVRDYKRANDYRLQRRNEELWLQGAYFYNAMCAVMSSAFSKSSAKYIEKPFDVIKKSKTDMEIDAEKERQKIIAFFTNYKKKWDSQHKE